MNAAHTVGLQHTQAILSLGNPNLLYKAEKKKKENLPAALEGDIISILQGSLLTKYL